MRTRHIREEELKRVLDLYLKALTDDLPSGEELASCQKFSPEFEARMARLIEQSKLEERRYAVAGPEPLIQSDIDLSRRSKRVLVAAIVLAILVSLFSAVAAREPVIRFIVQVYERFSRIVFQIPGTADESQLPDLTEPAGTVGTDAPRLTPGSTSSDLPAGFPTTRPVTGVPSDAVPRPGGKSPSLLPAGYTLETTVDLPNCFQAIYANSAGDTLLFERQPLAGLGIAIDTEGLVVESVVVGSNSGVYYAKNGYNNLIWQDGAFAYTISGRITKEEALNMAKATK